MSRRVRLIRSNVSRRTKGPNAGLWAVTVVAEVDGERRRVGRSARTEDEANDKVRRILDELATAPVAEPEPAPVVLVRDVVERYITRTLPLSNLAPTSQELYSRHLRRVVVPAIGDIPVADLEASDVEDMLAGYADRAASTRKSILQATRAALDVAMRDRHASSNVARLVRGPRQDPPQPKAYGSGELDRILEEADGDRLEALYVLLAWTGLRIGEALGLADGDVHADDDEPRLWVRGSLARVTGQGLVLTPGKSRTARRWVPLTPEAVAAVRRWRAQRAADRLAAGPLWEEHGYLFVTARGRPLDPRNVAGRYRALARAVGLDGGPHAARHTFATDLVRDGVPVRQVQELLGHASPTITLATYSKVTPDDKRSAVDRLRAARRSS